MSTTLSSFSDQGTHTQTLAFIQQNNIFCERELVRIYLDKRIRDTLRSTFGALHRRKYCWSSARESIHIFSYHTSFYTLYRMASQLSFSQFTPVAISPHAPLQSTPFEDVVSTSSNSSGSSPGGSSPNSSSNESSKDESGMLFSWHLTCDT